MDARTCNRASLATQCAPLCWAWVDAAVPAADHPPTAQDGHAGINMKHAMRWVLAGCALISFAVAAERPDATLADAEKGDASAMHRLCYGFLYGEEGRKADPPQAFRWCSAAARMGIPSSQTLLAEMYYVGTHVTKDIEQARAHYRDAADQGHPHAQFMLGRIAFLEEPHDPVAFCRWTRAAVLQGYDKAFDVLKKVEQDWRAQNEGEPKGYCDSVLGPDLGAPAVSSGESG